MKTKFLTFALAFAAICMVSCEKENGADDVDLSAYKDMPAHVESAARSNLNAIKTTLAADGYVFVKEDEGNYYFAPTGKPELATKLCDENDYVEGAAIVYYDLEDGDYCLEAFVVSTSQSAIKSLKNDWSDWANENFAPNDPYSITTSKENGLHVAKYSRANDKDNLD